MRFIVFFLYLSTACFAGFANADALPIKPGLWESTMTSNNSITGASTRTSQECMTEGEWDPKSMMEGAEGCELIDSALNGDTLNFSMTCDVQGAKSSVQGMYQSKGDSGSGSMNMEMDFGGQIMTMEAEFVANRIGDC